LKIDLKATNVFLNNYKAIGKRYIWNEGGARSSKTYSLCQLFIILAMKSKGKVFSIVRKSLPTLRVSVMRDFFDILRELGLYNEKFHNKTNNTYLLNGNIIEFISMDDPQKKRGTKRDYLWINEANELSEEDFKQLRMRTIGSIFFDYNPSFSKHWIYDFQDTFKEDSAFITSTYLDNPFLEQTVITEIENLKRLNSNDYNIYALGIRGEQSGYIFKSVYYSEFDYIPSDARGVIYCDPNLAKKGKGDTTGIVKLLYSASTSKFYISDFYCRSFSDSNELLDIILKLRDDNCRLIGFDGNVSQESSWTQHVRNYCSINKQPFPVIQYKRYRVDEIVKNSQWVWREGSVLFPPNFRTTEDGQRAIAQILGFAGKKHSAEKDDAPDALICGIEFLQESGFKSQNTLLKSILKR